MKQKREPRDREFEQTLFGLLIAVLAGAAISLFADSAFVDFQSIGDREFQMLARWQIDMGSICLGVAAFVVVLFCLEILSKRSKMAGWRSSWPWLPLIGLTAMATFVHIPTYIVLPAGAIYCGWAYRRISKVSDGGAPTVR